MLINKYEEGRSRYFKKRGFLLYQLWAGLLGVRRLGVRWLRVGWFELSRLWLSSFVDRLVV